jgi:hypothetical protein
MSPKHDMTLIPFPMTHLTRFKELRLRPFFLASGQRSSRRPYYVDVDCRWVLNIRQSGHIVIYTEFSTLSNLT